MFSPSDTYRFAADPLLASVIEGTNIYVICRRRRISVCPHSLEVKDGVLWGEFLVHGESYFEWERERFSLAAPVEPSGYAVPFLAAKPSDSFGHAIDVVDEHRRRVVFPSHAILASSTHNLANRTKLEVLYVGQAFGMSGERNFTDRLRRHTTLQRILADAHDSGANEILLLGFQYGSSNNVMSTAGSQWIEPVATPEEERSHMTAVGTQSFDRRTRILLAEAALINYFKPRYNELHRNSFRPEKIRKLKTLRKLLEADMSALIVEANTSNIRAKLWSEAAPCCAMDEYLTPSRVASVRANALGGDSPVPAAEFDEWLRDQSHAHVARFALYDKAERETFLHGLPWQ